MCVIMRVESQRFPEVLEQKQLQPLDKVDKPSWSPDFPVGHFAVTTHALFSLVHPENGRPPTR